MDSRLKLLAAIVTIAAIATLGYAAYFYWATNVQMQFGSPSSWPEHVTEINNMVFRYPETAFDVIVPEDEVNNPVSVVKKGEDGKSALIQVGTWRAAMPLTSLEDAVKRFEAASQKRTNRGVEALILDGRAGVMFVQDDEGGRRIIETLIWDNGDVREISLQLPGTASSVERALYEKLYRELLLSIRFLQKNATSSSDDSPITTTLFESSRGGFSLSLPSNWDVEQEVDNPDGSHTVTFQPKTEIGNSILADTGRETAYIVRVFPASQSFTLAEIDSRAAQPFRDTALPGSLEDEKAGLPGAGIGISLEARQPKIGVRGIVLAHLLALIAVPLDKGGSPIDTEPRGRGYVISVFYPGTFQQQRYLEQASQMTVSFRTVLGR